MVVNMALANVFARAGLLNSTQSRFSAISGPLLALAQEILESPVLRQRREAFVNS
jgi:hypothetical protein